MSFKSIDDVLHFETASGELVKIGHLHRYAQHVQLGYFRQLGDTRFFVFNHPDEGLIVFEVDFLLGRR